MKKQETIFPTIEQAEELVDRIAARAERFDKSMSVPEKQAMAQLLSDIGVSVDDLLDVSRLADNYAINAEIASPSEAKEYSRASLREALFTWQEDDGMHYCIQW